MNFDGFPERIRRGMDMAGLRTVRQLSMVSNVPAELIGELLAGDRRVGVGTLCKLSAAMGCNLGWLADGKPNPAMVPRIQALREGRVLPRASDEEREKICSLLEMM